MDTSNLIPLLAVTTFAAIVAGLAWSYFRTRRIQQRKDEL